MGDGLSLLFHFCLNPSQSIADGSDRGAPRGADFLLAQVVKINGQDQIDIRWPKSLKHLAQHVPCFNRLLKPFIDDGYVPVMHELQNPLMRHLLAPMIEALVPGNMVEPGGDRGFVPKRILFFTQGDKNRLRHICGLHRVF
jgi:hypothetical protein